VKAYDNVDCGNVYGAQNVQIIDEQVRSAITGFID